MRGAIKHFEMQHSWDKLHDYTGKLAVCTERHPLKTAITSGFQRNIGWHSRSYVLSWKASAGIEVLKNFKTKLKHKGKSINAKTTKSIA
jgi:hypothetical protein